MARKAGDAVVSATSGVRDMAQSAGSTMTGAARSLGDTASAAYHSASAKVKDTASSLAGTAAALEEKSAALARGTISKIQEQPLVLLGVGLALGAALGAAVPNSEAENRLMGETAEKVKKEAKEIASDQFDKATGAAERLIEESSGQIRGGGDGQAVQTGHFG